MRKNLWRAATLTATLAISSATFVDSATSEEISVGRNVHVGQVAGQYYNAHPADFIGLDAAIVAAGGDTVRFSFPDADIYDLTAAEAQALSDAASYAEVPTPPGDNVDIPIDAFKVSGMWYHVKDTDGEWWTFTGRWNFRDNFIGSGAPYDASGVAVAGTSTSCWNQDGDWIYIADYTGTDYSNKLGYRKGVTYSTSVWAINDRTSGFKLANDHGAHAISYRRVRSGCSSERPYAKYYYEHNQSGCGGWNFTIDIKILHLGYDCGGPQKLQKYTGLIYRPSATVDAEVEPPTWDAS